jgi:hypothetical protein
MRTFLKIAFCAICVWLPEGAAQTRDVFPIPGAGFGPMSPAVGDIDNDPLNGLETVISTSDGTVQALSSTGVLLWSAQTPNTTCAETPSGDKIHSSPVIGDLFGNGEKYVVVGYGGFRGKPCDGGVIAYRGATGAVAWTFSIKAWAKKERFFAFRHAVWGTPTLADVDRDGTLEVGFGSFDRNVYLLNSNGSVRWYYNAADTVFPSPAFADVAGDRGLEMIMGTDISGNSRIRPPTQDGGFVYAFKASGSGSNGRKFGFRSPEIQLWRRAFNQVIQASPVIADILPASRGLEVVTGTGCFFPQGGGDRRGKWYKLLSASTGKVLATLPITACAPSGAAVGDIDGDGMQEVVVSVSGASSAGGDGTSRLIAWRPATNSVLWSVQPKLGTRTDSLGGHYRRVPVIADIIGDGANEVLVNYSSGGVIFSGQSGEQLTCDSSPCTKPLLRASNYLQGSPVVADTNGDGVNEIIVAGQIGRQNALVRWNNPL